MFADEWGIRMLRTSEEFGNFAHSTLTRRLQSRWESWIKGRSIAGSMISRRKSQYRVFFDDGTGFYVTLAGRRMLGGMPVRFPHRASCFLSSEFVRVGERTFMGTVDGRVMEMDKGDSFAGDEIRAYFVTHVDYMRGMGIDVELKNVFFETHAEGAFKARIQVFTDYMNYDGLIPRVEEFAYNGLLWQLTGDEEFDPSSVDHESAAGISGRDRAHRHVHQRVRGQCE